VHGFRLNHFQIAKPQHRARCLYVVDNKCNRRLRHD
jgi:hypothetical protein